MIRTPTVSQLSNDPKTISSYKQEKASRRLKMTAAKVFHLFPLLPIELRLKIYREIALSSPPDNNNHQILKISYSPSLSRYISNTAPPITLSISRESREQALLIYDFLTLGPPPGQEKRKLQVSERGGGGYGYGYAGASSPYHHNFQPRPVISPPPTTNPALPIPISYHRQTLYISSLSPLLSTLHFQHTFLFHLSTSPSRHLIQSLAIDLRVWNELCENGFLGVLARMRGLNMLRLVVEFGRIFGGVLGWLEAPEWRGDLRWVARTACQNIERARISLRGRGKGELGKVDVRCVFLTRGGEQA